MHEAASIISKPGLTWERFPKTVNISTADSGWKLTVVSTESEFDALEQEWNSLAKESSCTVFQTFDWARTWWKHFGQDGKRQTLYIIVLSKNGVIAAIAPLFSEVMSIFGLAKATRLLFIGRKVSDYLDIIVRKGMEAEAYARLADHLCRAKEHWDIIFLEDIPNRSMTHEKLRSALSLCGMNGRAEITELCPRLELPASWDQYLTRHSKHSRQEIRRRHKRLLESFGATFETVADARELDDAFENFIELHQERWTQCGEPGVFAEPGNVAFHREVVRKLFARGIVRLSFLKIGGKRVAGSYSFVSDAEFSMYLLGRTHAGDAERFSPGRSLTYYNIQQAIGEGKRVLDFLRGDEKYKYELLAENEPNWTLTVYTQSGNAGKKAERIRNLNLLFESSRRRTLRELSHLVTTAKHNGVFLHKTLAYLARRPMLIFHDARRKTRNPLQPLYIDEA
jgi:CelD/BcsL family acetyltransferase involved in cellulose biosynthesis